jgi:hypothetical protein
MVRFSSIVTTAAVSLIPALAFAGYTGSAEEPKVAVSHRPGRPANVLDGVDQILESANKCDAVHSTKCNASERRVYDRLSGKRVSPQLPKDARYDASAGVFL